VLFEFLELYYMYLTHTFLYWPFHLIIFFIVANAIRGYYARKYKPYEGEFDRNKVKVSVIIPQYNEEIEILDKVIKSAIENKPDEIIVISDDKRKEVEQLVKKYAKEHDDIKVTLYVSKRKLGKRGSLGLGWLLAKGDIILQLDSDSIMEPNSLIEILKPFADPKVVGVQGHPLLTKTGSRLSFLLGQLTELSRDIVCRMLDGFLVVIDGKISAYRREFLIRNLKEFMVESWGGRKIILADDRALTYLANKQGYKTAYQSTAVAWSAAEPTLRKYINQQLRWVRSGYMYLVKDIKTGLFFEAPGKYRFQELTYLLNPVSFTVAWVQTLIVNVQVVAIAKSYILIFTGIDIPLLILSFIIFLMGLALNINISMKLMRVDKFEFKKLGIKLLDLIQMGIVGLFVIYPMMLYALITYRNVTDWLTR